MQQYDVDIVIFGGGIAGLWCLNRLRASGYHAILLETEALGAGQTVHSQGMIHGGVKYALDGVFGSAASAIAAMPPLWEACIAGHGEIDLSATEVLSRDYLMWSQANLLSKTTAFFASKLIRSRIDPMKKAHYPSAFQHPSFKGHAYRMNDLVLDAHSLISELAKNHRQWLYKVDQPVQFQTDPKQAHPEKVNEIQLGHLRIRTQHWLLAAGEGNQGLQDQLNAATATPDTFPAMQTRPLHQVLVKHTLGHRLFAHCVGAGEKPRLTITSHSCSDGDVAWYLGGALAENGVPLSEAQQITATRKELADLFPWLDFSTAHYQTLRINRAEPAQQSGNKPDNAFLSTCHNVSTAWPTKLTLAPHLAQQLMDHLAKIKLAPQANASQAPLPLQQAPIAAPPWEQRF